MILALPCQQLEFLARSGFCRTRSGNTTTNSAGHNPRRAAILFKPLSPASTAVHILPLFSPSTIMDRGYAVAASDPGFSGGYVWQLMPIRNFRLFFDDRVTNPRRRFRIAVPKILDDTRQDGNENDGQNNQGEILFHERQVAEVVSQRGQTYHPQKPAENII